MLQCAMVYAKLLQDEFAQGKLLSRQATGFSTVEISADWLQQIEVLIDKKKCDACNYEICLPEQIFSFSYDAMSSALVSITPVSCECPEFVKIGVRDGWQLKGMPNTGKTFFNVIGRNKIKFEKSSYDLEGAKVLITFVPAIDHTDAKALIPQTKELPILNTVLQIMLAAKNGNVIDKSNDQNPNATIETELNKNSLTP